MWSTNSSLYVGVTDVISTSKLFLFSTPIGITAAYSPKTDKHYVGAKLNSTPTMVSSGIPTTTDEHMAPLIRVTKDANNTIALILDMILYDPVPYTNILEEILKYLKVAKSNYHTNTATPNL